MTRRRPKSWNFTVTGCLALLLLGPSFFPPSALAVTGLSDQEAVDGLKQALIQGSSVAIGKLGVPDGFLGNPKVRIPLPEHLQKGASMLRMLGLGAQLDQLEVTMNRAAEAAVPEAKAILLESIKKMSIQDARQILTGGNTAATEYFRRTASEPLAARFLPIVKRATDQVGLARQYDQIAGPAAQLGLIDEKQATLDGYVTQKALDGLFLMMAEEERAIRRDPLGQGSRLLRKVFGAIR
ncbi:MAG: DUF4197 domain-containing protein [Pseudomonadota bacterium]|jgi:hypothetical protein